MEFKVGQLVKAFFAITGSAAWHECEVQRLDGRRVYVTHHGTVYPIDKRHVKPYHKIDHDTLMIRAHEEFEELTELVRRGAAKLLRHEHGEVFADPNECIIYIGKASLQPEIVEVDNALMFTQLPGWGAIVGEDANAGTARGVMDAANLLLETAFKEVAERFWMSVADERVCLEMRGLDSA